MNNSTAGHAEGFARMARYSGAFTLAGSVFVAAGITAEFLPALLLGAVVVVAHAPAWVYAALRARSANPPHHDAPTAARRLRVARIALSAWHVVGTVLTFWFASIVLTQGLDPTTDVEWISQDASGLALQAFAISTIAAALAYPWVAAAEARRA